MKAPKRMPLNKDNLANPNAGTSDNNTRQIPDINPQTNPII